MQALQDCLAAPSEDQQATTAPVTNPNLLTLTSAPPGVLGSFFSLTPISLPRERDGGASRARAMEREIQVARYNRIYKRKAPSWNMGFAPPVCPPGFQFCKVCNANKPIAEFYTNVKRYMCRRHHYERTQERFRQRVREDADNAVRRRKAFKMWFSTKEFLQDYLGRHKVEYERFDMIDLLVMADLPVNIGARLVPIDPDLPLLPRNTAVLSGRDFSVCMDIVDRTCSKAMYVWYVQTCNILPPNADPGRPDHPFWNPDYKRQDIDVIKLMQEELATENRAGVAIREYLRENVLTGDDDIVPTQFGMIPRHEFKKRMEAQNLPVSAQVAEFHSGSSSLLSEGTIAGVPGTGAL